MYILTSSINQDIYNVLSIKILFNKTNWILATYILDMLIEYIIEKSTLINW